MNKCIAITFVMDHAALVIFLHLIKVDRGSDLCRSARDTSRMLSGHLSIKFDASVSVTNTLFNSSHKKVYSPNSPKRHGY